MAKFVTKSTVIQKVDELTGELVEVETRKDFSVKTDSVRFYMVFFEKMASFYGISYISDMKIMVCMCGLAEYNTGIVHMTKGVRKKIQEETGISTTNISKNLKRLIHLGLISEEDGDYTINPDIFWKGSINARKEYMESGGIGFNITFYSSDLG